MAGVGYVTSASASVTVFKDSSQVPTIALAISSKVATASGALLDGFVTTRGADVALPGRATLASGYAYIKANLTCVPVTSGSIVPLDFSWFGEAGVVDGSASSGALAALPELSWTSSDLAAYARTERSSILSIPHGRLLAGRTYKFTLRGADNVNPSVFGNATAVVQVVYGPVTVVILGGDRTANPYADLVLKALANDPDNSTDASGAAYPFHYQWACARDGGGSCGSAITTALSEAEDLEPLLSLLPGEDHHPWGSTATYVFTVTATRESTTSSRSASASVAITADYDVNDLLSLESLTLQSVLAYDKSSPLNLACSGSSNAAYDWEVPSGISPDSVSKKSKGTGNAGVSYLKVAAGAMTEGATYTFTCCSPKCKADKKARVSLSVTVARPPSSGTCSLAGPAVPWYSGLSSVRISCVNWVSGSGSSSTARLVYDFRYTLGGGSGAEIPLSDAGTANSINSSLPAGSVSVVVYIRMSDSVAAAMGSLPPGTRLTLPAVTVLPIPKFTAASSRRRTLLSSASDLSILTDNLLQASAQGEYGSALTAATYLASFYNGGSAAHTCSGGDAGITKPAQLQSAATLAVLQQLALSNVESSNLLGLSSCTYQTMTLDPKQLSSSTAEAFAALLVAKLGSIAAATTAQPASTGGAENPYNCFLGSINNLLAGLSLGCWSNSTNATAAATADSGLFSSTVAAPMLAGTAMLRCLSLLYTTYSPYTKPYGAPAYIWELPRLYSIRRSCVPSSSATYRVGVVAGSCV